MSNREADAAVAEIAGVAPLESAIRRLIGELRDLRGAAEEARERAERSEALLRDFAEGRQDPATLSLRMEKVEAENDELRGRIERGRERIDQILASIRFLEDRR